MNENQPAAETVRAHVIVSGRVQGVCFRMYTRREADRLGLHGWVRNLPDRRVEFVAEGTRVAVEALIDWSRRGPTQACVKGVECTWEPGQGDSGGFSIAY